jgi:DNA-binding transcriptional regulator YiaG
MSKSTLKRSAPKRAGKSASQIKFHRPSAAEIRRATEDAVNVARRKSDEDIDRAIGNDPDTFEADSDRLVLVRPEDIDVARIRSGLGLTQGGFAAATGIPHRLISDWEQGRKKPSAAARAFLVLIDEFGEKALKRLAQRRAA